MHKTRFVLLVGEPLSSRAMNMLNEKKKKFLATRKVYGISYLKCGNKKQDKRKWNTNQIYSNL